MATLEDKLLGEKLQYYCSSSEDEDEDEALPKTASLKQPTSVEPPSWDGTSTNTGPKGVLSDWQRFKQLETEQRKDQERERLMLAKKLALSCRSHLDDEKEKQRLQEEEEEEDVDKLIDEGILRQFIQKRMEEMMMTSSSQRKSFGKLFTLNSADEFLEAVDKESDSVTVIIHLYDESVAGCVAMNGCLSCLAPDYPSIKFCCLAASSAGMSRRFQGAGLPALLVYKGGQMMGNFVRLADEFGDDFFATDVESFLIEHGMLQDKSLMPSVIQAADG